MAFGVKKRKSIRTTILQFEVIDVCNPVEIIGELFDLKEDGYYHSSITPGRQCSLIYLIDNPLYYRISIILSHEKKYVYPKDRRLNYAKEFYK